MERSTERGRPGRCRHLRIRPWLAALVALAPTCVGWYCVQMPGESHDGPLAPATEAQERFRARLEAHVEALGRGIGARSTARPEGLAATRTYLEERLGELGYVPLRQTFSVGEQEVANLEVELRGYERPEEVFVVGAHYDGMTMVPAANDNGSGVAACLTLAEAFRELEPACTLRFVFFANEEPPHFQTDTMGSLVYARRSKGRDEDVVAMWSLETLGYYTSEPDSQSYPSEALGLVYPSTGDFVAFVGGMGARSLVRETIGAFRRLAAFPSEGVVLPDSVPGVDWSDHWSFAQVGYPALMITDTAPFRYPHYHTDQDLPEHVTVDGLARVVEGLARVLVERTDARPGLR